MLRDRALLLSEPHRWLVHFIHYFSVPRGFYVLSCSTVEFLSSLLDDGWYFIVRLMDYSLFIPRWLASSPSAAGHRFAPDRSSHRPAKATARSPRSLVRWKSTRRRQWVVCGAIFPFQKGDGGGRRKWWNNNDTRASHTAERTSSSSSHDNEWLRRSRGIANPSVYTLHESPSYRIRRLYRVRFSSKVECKVSLRIAIASFR